MSRIRYGTAHGVDRDRGRKRITLQEAIEAVPSHPAPPPAAAREPALPEPGGRRAETVQCQRIAGDPVVRKVAHKFLTQSPVLVPHRLMAVEPTPLRQGFQSAAEPALGRLALHHPVPMARACPVM